ncbi:MAG: helix-turn-helix transcriptional regulator [Actinomycetota bacterium]|nr:helix-turn-helix transcriptional regulator [Actinomycetota bacterium]
MSNITDKINFLFSSKLSPNGDEYKYEEVARGTDGKLSPSYVWNLRKGKKDNPSREKIEALAKFFDVAPSFFFTDEDPKKLFKIDDRIEKIIADPKVKEIALRTLELNEKNKEFILTMVEKAQELAER